RHLKETRRSATPKSATPQCTTPGENAKDDGSCSWVRAAGASQIGGRGVQMGEGQGHNFPSRKHHHTQRRKKRNKGKKEKREETRERGTQTPARARHSILFDRGR
ncbi:hypothetical protein IscW_ISCW006564, partial [Ixodes scapularis]